MKTQSDMRIRAVSLSNLRAMCARASGMSHRFEVVKVSRSRVHVEYSNPDEYGNSRPVQAVSPCLPGLFNDADNPQVLIGQMLRTLGASGDAADCAYQDFDASICSAPPVYCKGMDGDWQTRREIHGTDRFICPDGVTRVVDWIHPYTNDTFAAFDVTAETPADTFKRIGGNRHFAYFVWSDLRAEVL